MEKLTKSQMMPEFSPKNIQSDLILFKEDILKDFSFNKIIINRKIFHSRRKSQRKNKQIRFNN